MDIAPQMPCPVDSFYSPEGGEVASVVEVNHIPKQMCGKETKMEKTRPAQGDSRGSKSDCWRCDERGPVVSI